MVQDSTSNLGSWRSPIDKTNLETAMVAIGKSTSTPGQAPTSTGKEDPSPSLHRKADVQT